MPTVDDSDHSPVRRSLNVVVSCVMVLSEAIRQTRDL